MGDPIYREAYPRLDILQAKLSNRASTNMELDRRVCRFWSRGGCPGDLVVPERADSSVVIDFKFFGPTYCAGKGFIRLPLVRPV